MKVLVIAADAMKREIQHKSLGAGFEFVWANSVEEPMNTSDTVALIDLEFSPSPERLARLAAFLPKPVFINAVAYTLAETNPSFIRINAWPGFLQGGICETVAIDEDQKSAATQLYKKWGWSYRFVSDHKGMIRARVVAMIINEAYFTLEAGVGTKDAIDLAMKLGTNYPFGPFEWSRQIGLKRIYELLTELYKTDPIYKICPLLEADFRENNEI